ncbi:MULTISPECIES: nitrite reductase small subunit NirD [Rhodobacterales]|uniref:nitrite reductase small subunit NirD n=1 Tax=Rhodobacterales TaxID=204455 RepID=UPI000BBE335F|nr:MULTISPECIES: nitrite reductase small subunit NirD [Paracoccaceae]MCE6968442.1 nitrite reductase small subunit NirD [Cereibacter sphaeroides]
MTLYIDIGALEDIPAQGARVVRTSEGCVAVFRTADDRVFALEDRCAHRGGPLSEGLVHGDRVTCPLHGWVFDMNTGEAQGADKGRIRTFAAKVEGGRIFLDAALLKRRSAA